MGSITAAKRSALNGEFVVRILFAFVLRISTHSSKLISFLLCFVKDVDAQCLPAESRHISTLANQNGRMDGGV